MFAALVDPDVGLCATRARFGHAHVVERVAALAAGRWTTSEIEALAQQFLATDLVVRLSPSADDAGRRRPPEWSTFEHRQLEDRVLADLATLRERTLTDLAAMKIDPRGERLGDDQRAAVDTLCRPGPALRVVLAAAGHGKTALTATAAGIADRQGHPVLALAATNKAVAELRAAGLEASTIARWRLDGARVTGGSVVVLDEVSQVSTRDAAAVLAAVVAAPGAGLWCLGDQDQGRSVAPGGLAVNRLQRDPAERAALADYRRGELTASQGTRATHGWEHSADTPDATREALAQALVADIGRCGPDQVVALAVSHADCEDLADRIRQRLRAAERPRTSTLDTVRSGRTERSTKGDSHADRHHHAGHRRCRR